MIAPEVLYDKLAGLAHPDDIAEMCRSYNIQGHASEDTSCALAVLFKKVAGTECVKVGQHIEWSKGWPDDEEWWDRSGWGECRPMSEAMLEFITRFDHSGYPDLEVPVEDYE